MFASTFLSGYWVDLPVYLNMGVSQLVKVEHRRAKPC